MDLFTPETLFLRILKREPVSPSVQNESCGFARQSLSRPALTPRIIPDRGTTGCTHPLLTRGPGTPAARGGLLPLQTRTTMRRAGPGSSGGAEHASATAKWRPRLGALHTARRSCGSRGVGGSAVPTASPKSRDSPQETGCTKQKAH